MDNHFFEQIFKNPLEQPNIPPNKVIFRWAEKLIQVLFPENGPKAFSGIEEVKETVLALEAELYDIISASCKLNNSECKNAAGQFFAALPELYRVLNTDIVAIYEGDPAAQSRFEVIRTYPGFYAICFYRIAHLLYNFNIPLVPRILTEYAHSKTGIDIHPAAKIGEYFYIDHGTGIVIGETSTIGQYVKLYQGVTLGALSVKKTLAGSKRHPTVEDRVVIYSGATILGGFFFTRCNFNRCFIGYYRWARNMYRAKTIGTCCNTYFADVVEKWFSKWHLLQTALGRLYRKTF